MRDINKVCKHCSDTFKASCGKEEFCSDKCKIHANIKVDDAGCWIWQRSKDKDGYGYLKAKGGKTVKVHRESYRQFNGVLEDGQFVCHTCDNPKCCNPAHLFAGNAKENKQDCITKLRDMGARGAVHHKAKLTDDNVREILASVEIAPRMAEKFGVHRNMIYQIRKGNNWKHLQR